MKLFGYELRFGKIEKRSETNLTTSNGGVSLGFGEIYNRYTNSMNISAVYRSVDLISDSIAMMPIRIKQNQCTEEKDHPLNYIFNNMRLTKYTFMKQLVSSVLLKGNGFAYIERNDRGTPISLRWLNSNDVIIDYNKNTDELWYRCQTVTSERIEPINMIHLLKNTDDGINGISVISYAKRTLKNANSTENSALNYFANGCNLSGIVKVDSVLSQEQAKDIRTAWQNAYTDGGSGLAILEGNMTYQPVQMKATDAQLIESRLFNVSDIARFFGISPVLLGDLSKSSYSTIEAAQNEFLIHTLAPYIKMIEDEFTRKLTRPHDGLQIELDENAILRVDKTATANYYGSLLQNGVLCINEVRQQLGYKPIEGGDKHIIAFTDIEQNTITEG